MASLSSLTPTSIGLVVLINKVPKKNGFVVCETCLRNIEMFADVVPEIPFLISIHLLPPSIPTGADARPTSVFQEATRYAGTPGGAEDPDRPAAVGVTVVRTHGASYRVCTD